MSPRRARSFRRGDRVALRYDEAWPVSWGTVRDVLPESRLAVDLDSGGWLIVPARMAAHETTETDT